MVHTLGLIRDRVLSFLRDVRAQDTFEYVLIIGGISVLVIVGFATPLGGALLAAVVNGTCDAINGIGVTCTSPIM